MTVFNALGSFDCRTNLCVPCVGRAMAKPLLFLNCVRSFDCKTNTCLACWARFIVKPMCLLCVGVDLLQKNITLC